VSEIIKIVKDDGVVEIRPEGDAGFEIELLPRRSDLYIPRKRCRTTFSLEMIQYWLERTEFAWFCDRLSRHEDQTTITAILRRQLFAYFAPEEFAGKRLLDFGCGTGASTLAIARMLPQTEIVGVELEADRIEIANRMKAYRRLQNVVFRCSPAGNQLPADTHNFDYVMLGAVYEHLLPGERKTLMPLLWSSMKARGVIFVNQTPYRYSPCEAHSTGLWLINYMPDAVTHWTVRHFAGRNPANRSKDWDVHLRGGIRGATEKEIIRNLTRGDMNSARILQPRQNGLRDRADLWLSGTNSRRYRVLKKSIATVFRFTDHVFDTIPGINLEVVIQKCDS
jgi:2-polyprenyl-3-methyl-5-hydroxy-6-metoxy-1,4-benzoquinol methylase